MRFDDPHPPHGSCRRQHAGLGRGRGAGLGHGRRPHAGFGHGRGPHAGFGRGRGRPKPLRARLFAWFGASILAMALSAGLILHWSGFRGSESWRGAIGRVGDLVASRYAEVWHDPERRQAWSRQIAGSLNVSVTLHDAAGRVFEVQGRRCERADFSFPVEGATGQLGQVSICGVWRPHVPWRGLLVLGAAGLSLWAASGLLARRLGRPLETVAQVAEDIGDGQLERRVHVDPRWPGELGALAESVNRMAARIERQLADQRELLAGVSHEIRSPLARLRVLLELGREQGTEHAWFESVERELVEVDSLVGELLAKSRLDFDQLDVTELDAVALAQSAIERWGRGAVPVVVTGAEHGVRADPTLLVRALVNLLDNAAIHAGGVARLVVHGHETGVDLSVEDEGPGFQPQDLSKVFDSFVRGGARTGSSLGLGLALVRRIAEAHGGRATAENRPEGGARVTMHLPRG